MHASVGVPVLESILLVDHYERPAGLRFHSTSRPGHLIQLMDSGVARQQVGGREYTLTGGDVIWYHEDESVTGEVVEGPWSFYTVNFIAPALPPPPFERRVRRAAAGTTEVFSSLLAAWRDDEHGQAVREMRVQSRLLTLLADLEEGEGVPYRTHPPAWLWWELETLLRQDLAAGMTLQSMADLAGKSPATIARACHEAVGQPPAKRIKQIRMSLARGLVRHSELGMGDIARQVGYARVHEFSRDYRKHFAMAPTADRRSYRAAGI